MKKLAFVLLLAAATCGCAVNSVVTPAVLADKASAWPLQISEGRVITDNDAAFLSKLRLIEEARTSIDLSYYIFDDDESSSQLTRALIKAAKRGVKVRLLVDYETNYPRLDLFSMMEHEGKRNLQVRLYNRPTANIVKDAVFMTMGCGKGAAGSLQENCSAEKYAAIDRRFAEETIDGVPAAGRNISNLDIGNSGLFLSGLYAKRSDVLALAVQKGEGVDLGQVKGSGAATSPEEKERVKQLGKVYWQAKTGAPFQRVEANAELFFAFAMYGSELNPLKDTVSSLLPLDRAFGAEEARDWDHFTDYTHHKFLLVDREAVQMGGRNVENSYHMRPNSLISKYVFMDTDLFARLEGGGDLLARAFESLWNFTPMVATVAEVRQHAPNDFVANLVHAEANCPAKQEKAAREACVAGEMQTNSLGLAERMGEARRMMESKAKTYQTSYLPSISVDRGQGIPLDKGSVLAYLENLPFDRTLPADKRERTYGAEVGKEAASGKYIHDIWLRELPAVCSAASAQTPKRIVLHNAYFFPPGNLTHALSRLVDGSLDCSHVTVTVLTNSIATTDLNVVNLAARHSLKAFTEFYQQRSNPERRAAFEYYEYQPPAHGPNLSLHTKVSVFGDDIVVGSANADVRSFMMDSNNAMLVRNAPDFAREYLDVVQKIVADPGRVKKLNDYFATTPRDAMLQEDLVTFRSILAKYRVDKRLSAEQESRVEARFRQMLDDAYTMTGESISPDLSKGRQRDIQDKFDEEFKPI